MSGSIANNLVHHGQPIEQQQQQKALRNKRLFDVVDSDADDNNFDIHSHDSHELDGIIQTTKSRGIMNVQLFIRKAFAMINECDPNIASWTHEGDKFVVRDRERFALATIPQYYDHNNYSSFTRQLNFYGFAREQSIAIKINDEDTGVGQETFYHQYFQRGRPDLLKHLQRKSRDGGKMKRKKPKTDNVNQLEEKINALEQENADMEMTIHRLEESTSISRMAIKELEYQQSAKDMTLGSMKNHIDRLECQLNAILNLQQQAYSSYHHQQQGQISNVRATSVLDSGRHEEAKAGTQAAVVANGPTLAPHPKKKKFNDQCNLRSSAPYNNTHQSSASSSGGLMEEPNLDLFRDSSVLYRDTSMMNWLSRLSS